MESIRRRSVVFSLAVALASVTDMGLLGLVPLRTGAETSTLAATDHRTHVTLASRVLSPRSVPSATGLLIAGRSEENDGPHGQRSSTVGLGAGDAPSRSKC